MLFVVLKLSICYIVIKETNGLQETNGSIDGQIMINQEILNIHKVNKGS